MYEPELKLEVINPELKIGSTPLFAINRIELTLVVVHESVSEVPDVVVLGVTVKTTVALGGKGSPLVLYEAMRAKLGSSGMDDPPVEPYF